MIFENIAVCKSDDTTSSCFIIFINCFLIMDYNSRRFGYNYIMKLTSIFLFQNKFTKKLHNFKS